MFKTLRSAWALEDLRKKMIFTMMILLLYRIINVIPVPFINSGLMSQWFNESLNSTILGLYNAMSGFGLSQASVLALGIQPYINASIIIQLLTVAIPALERMAKEEGEVGKKKIEKITRIATVVIGVMLGFGYFTMIKNNPIGIDILERSDWQAAVVIITTFTAGSCFVMWLGERINEKGIGNGISMILFANILSSFPDMIGSAKQGLTTGITIETQAGDELAFFKWWHLVIIGVLLAAVTVFIIFVNDAERRIPIQYAKRVVGRKVYGGQSTNLPIKVSMSGVMPVIFASSITTIPALICNFTKKGWWYWNVFHQSSWIYVAIYALLIFFFSWFYSTIQYDPVEISNNLKKNGGFIPGFRPGKPTAEFIKKVISKILVFGAVYLSVVALLPMIGNIFFKAAQALAIGGTSVIIVVGVALETVKALEAQMMMRHYKGFLD